MRNSIHTFVLILLSSVIFSSLATASEQSLSAMRKTFLQAEQYIAAERDDDYFAIADSLKNYPLYPYLHYQWLSRHLDDDAAIQRYLHDFPHTRYAALLHRKWLANLGSKQAWPVFVRHYARSDDRELQCYFAQAQYNLGHGQDALDQAKTLWSLGKQLPSACDKLFEWLKVSSDFTSNLVWQRFETALRQNNDRLANDILPLIAEPERQMARVWLKLHKQPELVKKTATWKRHYGKAALLFAHTITRWLENDPQAAAKAWDAEKKQFDISPKLAADTEKRLGIALAIRRDKHAYARLSEFAGDDPAAQEWRVRAALNQQDWPNVLKAVEALSDTLKNQDKWQYWRARALQATQHQTESESVLQELAKHRSFYAFLATNHLQQTINLNHQAIQASAEELYDLQNRDDFLMVGELLNLDRKSEATRQWWHAISGLGPHQLAVAAKLAQTWQWPSMAIFTIAKAKNWDDMDLRFPLMFRAEIERQANDQGLDTAIIFALIRQESAFDEYAGSPAGAMGLMQLMPKTARQVAGELKERWHNDFNLLLPEINIKYGSYYFKRLLKRYDGHHVLAIASYNAGPARVKQWLPEKHSLPADIWIETIPYKETRTYVSSVIMYALIYQERLQKNRLQIADLLPEVGPG